MNENSMWLGGGDAGSYVGCSRDWVEVRVTAWPLNNQPVPGRIRYKTLKGCVVRKYYRPDLDAFLE